MKAIILFQIGNIEIALNIFNQISLIYNNFNSITFFISILEGLNIDIIMNYIKTIKITHPNMIFIIQVHKNKGMDIGPFILQMRYLVKNNLRDYDILIKLHTKTNNIWRNELLNPLINNMNLIMTKLSKNTNIGLIGSKKWYLPQDRLNKNVVIKILEVLKLENKYFDIVNNEILLNYTKSEILDPVFYTNYNKLSLNSLDLATKHYRSIGKYDKTIIPHPNCIVKYHTVDTYFIGGTIFCAKYDIFYDFFNENKIDSLIYPLLEQGYLINTKPSIVHALERFLCLICYIKNQKMDYVE